VTIHPLNILARRAALTSRAFAAGNRAAYKARTAQAAKLIELLKETN